MSRPAFARAVFAFYRYPLYAYGYAYKYGTTLVSSLTVSTNAASASDVYTYTYNNLGYITNINKNGATIASYGYASLGASIKSITVSGSYAGMGLTGFIAWDPSIFK